MRTLSTFKETKNIWFVIFLLCFLIFLGLKVLNKTFFINKNDSHSVLSPTPNLIITRNPENSESLVEAKNKYLQFLYPVSWSFYSNEENYFISVSKDSEKRELNDFSVMALYLETCTPAKCLSAEEQITNQESYWFSSTSQLGDMDPIRLSEKEITINDNKGRQYVYKLMKPYEGNSDTVIWYFIPYKDKIFWIKVMGSDMETLNNILLSFKFLK